MAIEQLPEARQVFSISENRVGIYLWGGPGTIRMIKVKFFNPRIDIDSHMTCYDYEYLARLKDLFGITDVWASYSWGFSDKTEVEDKRFLLDRIENFRRLDLRVHAYIQGPNLVYEDFKSPRYESWWARDERNRLVTYYRGRKVCSIHNEEYMQYVITKIEDTYNLGFDGIYIDNIQHGQLGTPTLPGELPFVFCGDRSKSAQHDFRAVTGYDIPKDFEVDPELTACYLDFRVETNTQYVMRMAEAAHAGGMEFGTNFYDPKFDPRLIYGIDMKAMATVQDYILFENHALPRKAGKKHNGYVEDVVKYYNIDKPVFVVTYNQGVGFAPQFTQENIDNVFSEAAQANFLVCLKGGEFTTRSLWHCLYLDALQPPDDSKRLPRLEDNNNEIDTVQKLLRIGPVRKFIKRNYNPLMQIVFEWQVFRFLLIIVYQLVLK